MLVLFYTPLAAAEGILRGWTLDLRTRGRVPYFLIMASWSVEEWNRQYSPSQWSKRLPADTIVDAHLKSTSEGTKVVSDSPTIIFVREDRLYLCWSRVAATRAAQQAVRCEVGVEYEEAGGQTLDVYHACTSDGGIGHVHTSCHRY